MRGGKLVVDSLRHDLFVEDHAYQVLLRDVCDRFGYSPAATVVTATVPALV